MHYFDCLKFCSNELSGLFTIEAFCSIRSIGDHSIELREYSWWYRDLYPFQNLLNLGLSSVMFAVTCIVAYVMLKAPIIQ